jgi:hypothetical protein
LIMFFSVVVVVFSGIKKAVFSEVGQFCCVKG